MKSLLEPPIRFIFHSHFFIAVFYLTGFYFFSLCVARHVRRSTSTLALFSLLTSIFLSWKAAQGKTNETEKKRSPSVGALWLTYTPFWPLCFLCRTRLFQGIPFLLQIHSFSPVIHPFVCLVSYCRTAFNLSISLFMLSISFILLVSPNHAFRYMNLFFPICNTLPLFFPSHFFSFYLSIPIKLPFHPIAVVATFS